MRNDGAKERFIFEAMAYNFPTNTALRPQPILDRVERARP